MLTFSHESLQPVRRHNHLRNILTLQDVDAKENSRAEVNFEDIKIIKRIDKGKCLIYLAKSIKVDKKYVLKVFPCPSFQKKSAFFNNEVRFKNIDHPHVIKIAGSQECIKFIQDFKAIEASCLIIEYAPFGDLCQAMLSKKIFENDEILIRTYFRQLIEGLEYLHNRSIHHLDIKLDNLLLGDDYILKIGDFDNSHFGSEPILSRGTVFYRAPELARSKCTDPVKADVYSAGVVLFAMKSGGYFPHSEDSLFKGYNLYNLFIADQTKFWLVHAFLQKKPPKFYSQDFKDLVNGMLALEPDDRFSIEDIKKSKWYRGDVFELDQLPDIMSFKLPPKNQ